ncbi:hypothetical protein Csa_009856, partial [Cucumis sativus]
VSIESNSEHKEVPLESKELMNFKKNLTSPIGILGDEQRLKKIPARRQQRTKNDRRARNDEGRMATE